MVWVVASTNSTRTSHRAVMSKSKKPRNKKMSAAKKQRLQQASDNNYGGLNFNPLNNKGNNTKSVNPVAGTKVFRGASRGS